MQKPLPLFLLLATLLTLRSTPPARATDIVRCGISADAILQNLRHTMPPGCEIHSANGQITIDAKTLLSRPMEIPLFELNNPPLQPGRVALRGQASYSLSGGPDQPGSGQSYLQMKNTLANGESWWAMNTDVAGLAQAFYGHSSGRPFLLTFTPPGTAGPVKTIAVSLAITSPGTITLSGSDGNVMDVVQDAVPPGATASDTGAAPLDEVAQRFTELTTDRQRQASAHLISEDQRRLAEAEIRLNERSFLRPWVQQLLRPLGCDQRTAGWIAAAGLLAALLVVIASLLAPRDLGIACIWLLGAADVAAFGWGTAALGAGLPAGLPVAVCSILLLAALLASLPVIGRRRQNAELRKMAAMDVA